MAKTHSFSVSEYIERAASKKGLAAVPEAVAAEFLNVDPSEISNLINSGDLKAIIIDGGCCKWRGVSVTSLRDFHELRLGQRSEWKGQISEVLKGVARTGKFTGYERLSNLIGVQITPHNIGLTAELLNEVVRSRYAKDGVLWSALVLLKGTSLPSDSFFDFARELDLWTPKDDMGKFWENQVEAVRQFVLDNPGKKKRRNKKNR